MKLIHLIALSLVFILILSTSILIGGDIIKQDGKQTTLIEAIKGGCLVLFVGCIILFIIAILIPKTLIYER